MLLSDDFHEIPQTCPFMTTCPLVCVERVEDCPTDCGGSESGWNASGVTLCVSGSCEMDCSQYDAEMDNPCTCPLFPVACPRVVDYYDDCFSMFQPFYDSNVCPDEELEPIPQVSTTAFFTIFYTWISSVTVLTVCWCCYNERLCPRYSKTSMPMIAGGSKPIQEDSWYQHGYRRCVSGTTIFVMVIITIIGIQFLLFFLTTCFYIASGSIAWWAPVFNDPWQVQRVFIVVWFVGFTWLMSLSYVSTGLRHLFLRRCCLSVATHVLVVAPSESILKQSQIRFSTMCVRWLLYPFSAILRTILSNPHAVPGKTATFCKVTFDKVSGRRWISYRLQRYVFDSNSGSYMPGRVDVGKNLGDFIVQAQGLTAQEVAYRAGIVGLNKAMMPKPTFVSSLAAELSKRF
jgi:hypothetical protein